MCELLWSDPQSAPGRAASKRGVGIQFGPDVTEEFLRTNKLDYIIRSHEVKHLGYEVAHDEKCITVFSAPNYWLVCMIQHFFTLLILSNFPDPSILWNSKFFCSLFGYEYPDFYFLFFL